MERIAICGGRLLTPQGILEQHILLAEDGVIFFNVPATTEIYTPRNTLSPHAALPM